MANNNFDQFPFNEGTPKQLNDYLQSFDDLRDSINSLNSPLTNISKNVKELNNDFNKLSSTLNQVTKENQNAGNTIDQLNGNVEKLTKSYDLWEKAIKIARTAVLSLEGALTAGLSVIMAFGPEILGFVSSLIKGTDAINNASLSLSTLNKGFGSSDYSKAIKQFNELKINVDLAQKGFLNKKQTLDQYNETLGKSMGYANTLDQAEKKLTANGPAYIQMTLNKAAAQIALQDAAKKSAEAQQIKLQSDDETLSFWDKAKAYASNFGNPLGYFAAQNDLLTTAEEESSRLLNIAEEYQKKAALIAKNNNLFFEPKENNNAIRSKASKPKPRPTVETIAAQSITIAQHFENEKKAYDSELALLNDQLNKKLISQADYNKQSQALQEQYHQGIGSSIEKFALEDMAKTQKHLKDVAEAEGKLAYDETNVKKAILPGQKLDAEKQLITDKYNYEIVLANGNAEKIKELEIKKQEALTSVTQQYEQQRKEFALNTAQQVADKAFSIIGNNIKSSSDAKIKGLEKDKAGELSNKNLTQTQRKAIEDKYQKKEAQEKTKAFKAEQRMSVLQAVVNGALAVTKATAQTGILAPFVIPGIIASTALQIATIVAQKPPAFAKGGRFVSDGRGALLPGYSRTDNTNAFLRSGEAVVVSEAMRNPWARNLVSAINVAHGGRDFSMPNTGRGYAIGGIFTDGGNANRYYNQPVNDAKELANTLAYQMINNFPPIYVDVKDVNNQQNILAQTVNRVNL
jgi:outer membrane murein-binding lipoprotein Lpp